MTQIFYYFILYDTISIPLHVIIIETEV